MTKQPSDSTKLIYVLFGGIESYRFEMNIYYRLKKKWGIPLIWSVIIKYLVPISMGFALTNHIEEYYIGIEYTPKLYKSIMYLFLVISVLIIFAFVIFPNLELCFAKNKEIELK